MKNTLLEGMPQEGMPREGKNTLETGMLHVVESSIRHRIHHDERRVLYLYCNHPSFLSEMYATVTKIVIDDKLNI
ncbi:hypothetical protein HanPSC8_Chr08g0335961 [Helianthus annuus]|nr:hypothetical protein HanPSC8_Chr08g0335961 [Helianthus annuus]